MCVTGHPDIDRTDPAQVAATTDPGKEWPDSDGRVLYCLRTCRSCKSSLTVAPEVVAAIDESVRGGR
jgi:hypothetical protein